MDILPKAVSLSDDVISFINEVFSAAWRHGKRLVLGFYHHIEAVTILLLASLGLNALMGELPFYMTLPLWIEASMVIPVLSVAGISFLVTSSSWRAKRRMAKHAGSI